MGWVRGETYRRKSGQFLPTWRTHTLPCLQGLPLKGLIIALVSWRDIRGSWRGRENEEEKYFLGRRVSFQFANDVKKKKVEISKPVSFFFLFVYVMRKEYCKYFFFKLFQWQKLSKFKQRFSVLYSLIFIILCFSYFIDDKFLINRIELFFNLNLLIYYYKYE